MADESKQSEPRQWHVALDGQRLGPLTAAQLRRLVADSPGREILVWRAGMKQWLPADQLGLATRAAGPEPPPLPGSQPTAGSRPSAAPPPAARSRASHRQHVSRPVPRRSSHSAAPVVFWTLLVGLICLLTGLWAGYEWAASNTVAAGGRNTAQRTPLPRSSHSTLPHAADSAAPRTGTPKPDDDLPGTSTPLGPEAGDPRPPTDHSGPAAGAVTHSSSSEAETRPSAPSISTPTNGRSAGTEDQPETDPRPTGLQPNNGNQADRPVTRTPFYQEVTIERHPLFNVQGLTMRQDLRYQIVSRMAAGAAASDGRQSIRQTVVHTALIAADDLSRSAMGDALGRLRGRQFQLTINRQGEVIGLEGFKDDVRSTPVKLDASKGFLVASAVDRDGWKELATWTFFQPPAGDQQRRQWRRQMTHQWDPLGQWYGMTTFRRERDPQHARFTFVHDMKYVPPKAADPALPFAVRGADFRPVKTDGVLLYDESRHRVAEAREVFQVQGDIQAELLGQKLPMQLQEQQSITVRVLDQWSPQAAGRARSSSPDPR